MPKNYTASARAQSQHYGIAMEVFHETDVQLVKWDVQDHPMGTGPKVRVLGGTEVNLDLRYASELSRIFRQKTEDNAEDGSITYWDILAEEFFEAGAEDDPEALEKELIQVAAVAVSMVAASRRQRGA